MKKKYRNLVPAMPLRLEPELKEKLKRLADKEGVNMSDWIRMAIRKAKDRES